MTHHVRLDYNGALICQAKQFTPSLRRYYQLLLLLCSLLTAACSMGDGGGDLADRVATGSTESAPAGMASPAASLPPLTLTADEQLHVAVTTGIIGDIVAQVGGDAISLTTLIEPGIDPHSYTLTPQALRTLGAVDLIFINGLHLEEGLTEALAAAGPPVVSVNELVTPLTEADEHTNEIHADEHDADADEHEHGPVDPHTWFSVPNVQQWVTTIETALSSRDPIHAERYQANAAVYQATLTALDEELRATVATVPADQRKLVTDHETLNYFAAEYEFTLIGALIGSLSSTAESSAQEFAALQDQLTATGAPAIFIGSTANPALAEQLAQDLGITVVPLYTGSLSEASGPAATYVDFMRYNVNAIVTALRAKS